jgi:hypothetical protein
VRRMASLVRSGIIAELYMSVQRLQCNARKLPRKVSAIKAFGDSGRNAGLTGSALLTAKAGPVLLSMIHFSAVPCICFLRSRPAFRYI